MFYSFQLNTIRQPGFNLPHHTWSLQQFPRRPRLMSCKSEQMWSCPITFLWLWPATDHETHSLRHVSTNKFWRRTETTPWSGWRHSHMAGINNDHSTHKTNEFNTGYTVITCETTLFQPASTSVEIILFQHMETCLKLIQKLFQRLIAAHRYFPTRSLSLK